MNTSTPRSILTLLREPEERVIGEAVNQTLPNCSIQPANNGAELVEMVRRNGDPAQRPFVIVSEALPEMGIQNLVTGLRKLPRFLPIIVLRPEARQESSGKTSELCSRPFESVISVFPPIYEPKASKAIFDAGTLADDFYRLQRNKARFQSLSPREVEILRLATVGVPNKSIARRLAISIKTVEINRKSAYTKLQISSAAEMAAMVTFQKFCGYGMQEVF